MWLITGPGSADNFIDVKISILAPYVELYILIQPVGSEPDRIRDHQRIANIIYGQGNFHKGKNGIVAGNFNVAVRNTRNPVNIDSERRRAPSHQFNFIYQNLCVVVIVNLKS